MNTTTSRDGTAIAFDQLGHGAPVILVMGAFNDRRTGARLADFLASQFTLFNYDRRGRGDSGDAATYSVQREIEDLEAMIGVAGGSASVVGYSSGAMIALETAAQTTAITKLVLYELPPMRPARHATDLASLIAAGRRGDAVEYFQREVVGIPEHFVAQLRHAPFRPALEAMAHTVVYDATLISEERDFISRVRQPTLAIAADAQLMREVADALARSLPNARSVAIEGTHDIVPAVLGPVIAEFLTQP
ncbi:MAG: alpha/beta hydrolase [Acidobacteria bacterium]|nr:alpha/beta hydrolase [Acidobacteriota bacterium]